MIIDKKVEELERKLEKACKPLQGMPIALSGGIDSSVLARFINPRFALVVTSPGNEIYNEFKYAKKVAKHLGIKLHQIKTSKKKFLKEIKEVIKIQGTITPHFNIYALYMLFKTLHEMGEKSVVIADGPDESMSGYARNLIVKYLYNVYDFEAFKPYKQTIDKILPSFEEAYKRVSGIENSPKGKYKGIVQYMNRIDMEYKRPEMDLMGIAFAKHFGIKVYKPYETPEIDEFMFNLPDEYKIDADQYGKYLLRLVASKYLPAEIAWRKVKRGGPIFPVNKIMKWNVPEFDKEDWIRFQREVLGEDTKNE